MAARVPSIYDPSLFIESDVNKLHADNNVPRIPPERLRPGLVDPRSMRDKACPSLNPLFSGRDKHFITRFCDAFDARVFTFLKGSRAPTSRERSSFNVPFNGTY